VAEESMLRVLGYSDTSVRRVGGGWLVRTGSPDETYSENWIHFGAEYIEVNDEEARKPFHVFLRRIYTGPHAHLGRLLVAGLQQNTLEAYESTAASLATVFLTAAYHGAQLQVIVPLACSKSLMRVSRGYPSSRD